MANAKKTNLIVWFLNKATGSPEREDNRKLEAYAAWQPPNQKGLDDYSSRLEVWDTYVRSACWV